MATLAGATIATTFKSLLKLAGNTDDLAAGGSTAIQVMTGDGENTPIYLNTDRVGIGTSTPVLALEISAAGGAELSLTTQETTVVDSVALGTIYFRGTDGYAQYGAKIRAEASDEWSTSNDAPSELQFYTQSNGTSTDSLSAPRMVIDENGKVGIGTASPATLLEMWSNAPYLTIHNTSEQDSDEGREGIIIFEGEKADSTETRVAEIRSGHVGSGNNYNGFLSFWTNQNGGDAATTVEAMRITENGIVGIGITDPTTAQFEVVEDTADGYAARLFCDGNNASSKGLLIRAGEDTPSGAGDCKYIVFLDGDGTPSGGIQSSVTPVNPLFFNGSDERIKKNIVDTRIDGLAVINGFGMKQFEFKLDKYKGQVTDIGFIAQNCEDVYPQMVSEHKEMSESFGMDDPVKCVSDAALIPVLVKAVQELSAKVTALENA